MDSGKAQCERGPAFRLMLAGSPVPGDPASGVLLLTPIDGEGAGLVAKAASSRTLTRPKLFVLFLDGLRSPCD